MNSSFDRRPGLARSGGFSLLELCFAIVLVSAAAGTLLRATLFSQELAEKTVMELTLLNMRSGVRLQIADKMIHGREAELDQVVASNPVNWLEKPPPGYVGEVDTAASGSLKPGDWFYDTERKELGYIPKLTDHLGVEASPARGLRWRMRGVRSKQGDIEDLSLVSVTRYTWF